jgi:dCMP deaminase
MEKKLETYMEMARAMSKLSPDSETKVGAIMLSENGRVVAASFNGFARGADDSSLPNTRPDKYQYIQHAERNMLYNCAFEGIRTKETTIICTLSPCLECVRACFQSGVRTIVFDELYHRFPDTDFYTNLEDIEITVQQIGKYTRLQMFKKDEKVVL